MKIYFFSLLLLYPVNLLADSVAEPHTYTATSKNGDYIFVMIPPAPLEKELDSWIEDKGQEIASIRKKYSDKSGMYKNDGSTDALWSVNWYAFSVIPSSNGTHVIRFGLPWVKSGEAEAFSIIKNGDIVKSYPISSIVDFPAFLPRAVSTKFWKRSARLINGDEVLEVVTNHFERLKFDVNTGKVLDSIRPPRIILGVFACLTVIFIWIKMKPNKLPE